MECARTWDLLSAYLEGDLPKKESEEIAQHLRQCSRCAEEERALKETLSLLRNLPAMQAPPELLEGVRLRVGKEPAKTSLWKKLFLPAHIKIPLEAAAVVLVFLLAYGIQKEIPSSKAPPSPPAGPPAAAVSGKPEIPADAPAGRQMAKAPVKRRSDAADREARKMEAPREESGATAPEPEEKERADVFGVRPEKPAARAKAELPAVPATRASTEGRTIGPASSGASPEKEAPATRLFALPESRLLRPPPYERDVTIEVDPDARAGVADRIAGIVLPLGGTFHREITIVAGRPGTGEAPSIREIVRVVLPLDRADVFFEELDKLGTIPSAERPARIDFSSGPAPETVVYTVRIRVR